MTTAPPSDLAQWLATVTRGLPEAMASDIQDEIEAHYEDAIFHYVSRGLGEMEAHQKAMTDLGAAKVPAQQFWDMHYANHYILAIIASTFIVLIPFGLKTLLSQGGIDEASGIGKLIACFYDVSVAGLTVFVLFTLKRLLNWRFDVTQLDAAFTVVVVALSLQTICDMSGLVMFGYSMNISPTSVRSLLVIQDVPELLIALLSQICFFALGGGLLWISAGLIRFNPNLYGLNNALAVVLGLLGIGLASGSLLLNLQFGILAQVVGLLVTTSHMLVWPMMILLFFRVSYHNPAQPTRFA